MATTLPTFTVQDATAQRLLAAFSGQKDENGVELTPANAYKRWLRDNLVSYVIAREKDSARVTLATEIT